MIIVRTPLRIGFVGGGSDIATFYKKAPGEVISSAIDKFVYVIVKERFDDMIYINYSKKECVKSVADINHDLVREAMKITGVDKGVEITTLADVPSEGSGLGSSSSVTVGLLHALYAYANQLVTAEDLADQACRIEIDILKKPIGRQDQYAAAFGGINHFSFHADDTVTVSPVTLEDANFRRFSASLLMYYTGITRSADLILTDQKKRMEKKDTFGVMQKMVALTSPFKEAILEGDLQKAGAFLHENWELKTRMAAKISNPLIAEMYAKALKAGALGGKITGAGGGGFLVLLAPRKTQETVFQAMEGYRELPFMLERSGSKVIFDNRRYPSK